MLSSRGSSRPKDQNWSRLLCFWEKMDLCKGLEGKNRKLWTCQVNTDPSTLQHVRACRVTTGMSDSVILCTAAHQASLCMGFSRQEYWSGLLFPSPGDLPKPGIEPRSSALWADAVPSEPPGSGKEPACQCRRGRRGRFNPWDWIFYWTSNKEYWIPERQITLVVKSVGAGILHSWVLVSNLTNHLISISLSLKEEC